MHEACPVVAGQPFERVTERMAEVEQRAVALLALVPCHGCGLGPATRRNGFGAGRAAREDGLPLPFEPGEERRVIDQAIFDDLGVTGPELPLRQRREAIRIGEHQRRLVEGADEILAVAGIDAGLAADGGIHLGQETRRNLHEAHPALGRRRDEAREIAHDAPAQRHDDIAALEPSGLDGLAHPHERIEGFRSLARLDFDDGRAQAGGIEACLQPGQVVARHIGVRHHRAGRARRQGGDAVACRLEQRGADQDFIGAGPESHRDADAGIHSPCHGMPYLLCPPGFTGPCGTDGSRWR